MSLITLQDICMHVGHRLLLEQVNLTVVPGERVCLVGRNGVGKSTLMRIIAGRVTPDSGTVIRAQDLVVGHLEQGVPDDLCGSVFDVVCERLGPKGTHLAAYRRLCQQSENGASRCDAIQEELLALQQTIDAENGWLLQQAVSRVLSQMNLPFDGEVGTFSAGNKRQVLLAAAVAKHPNLLLLDEPTNHLDISAIDRLEAFLQKWKGTLVLITHDRLLIRRLATRIVEIDRGSAYSWSCGYDTYCQRNEARLSAEVQQHARFDKHLAAEEAWIRQGIKARRTRNEGRVRKLEELRRIRRSRRDRTGRVRMAVNAAERTGNIVVEAIDLTFGYGHEAMIEAFSCTIMRGDRIGILGPNGAGKSTLIRLLLGELHPRQGRVRYGTHLNVRYFDQLREQLDEKKTVQQNIVAAGDMLEVNGRRRHVIGYLKDFLFSPERSRTPVWVLSGGEKNRLLLAKLFSQPANVLVLDEPTNDLDVETLELLEELLSDFGGTVLLVSHDRAFINNVVTSTLVFEGGGHIEGYAGGYDDWLVQRPVASVSRTQTAPGSAPAKPTVTATVPPQRLGYMEKRELAALPDQIESLEVRQAELFEMMSDPEFYREDGARIAAMKAELNDVERGLAEAYTRWETLETRNKA